MAKELSHRSRGSGSVETARNGPMPSVQAGDLAIAFEEYGNSAAPAVLMLHGWPDNATTWDHVVPDIAALDLRIIVPTLRGFGDTRFPREDTPRTGNSGTLANQRPFLACRCRREQADVCSPPVYQGSSASVG
jgi:pimeloyl-ACP methyl ester carboxylesterase